MPNFPFAGWTNLALASWKIGLEGSEVAGLRLARIASGHPAAASESMLMISEKMKAATEIQLALLDQGHRLTPLSAMKSALRVVAPVVSANRKRMGKRKSR